MKKRDKSTSSPQRRFHSRSSTRSFFKEARRIPGNTVLDRIHGYVYIRWPYFYIGLGKGNHPLFRFLKPLIHLAGRLIARNTENNQDDSSSEERVTCKRRGSFADSYHGKVVPLEAAEELVTVNKEICLKDLEHVIPYTTAKDIILKNPDHIVVLDCPCRVVQTEPCLPLDVCLVIGEPFAGFVIEHHPNRARWIDSEQALIILREEEERGHVHHAFFKDALLGRFYAICNCCACCCGAIQAHHAGTPMLASSGYVCEVKKSSCTGCGTCVEICQFHALDLDDSEIVVNQSVCMGCGLCVTHCPAGAIHLKRDETKSVPLELNRLVEEADL